MIIIEGFKKVGKDYYINNNLKNMGYFPMHYDDFGFKTGDYGLTLPNSFIVGAVLSKLPPEISGSLVLNRGILSTWIYSMQDNMGVEKYIKRHYLDDLVKNKATILFIVHQSKETAKEMFKRDRRENDEHDNFKDFNDYWTQYIEYNNKAFEIMKILNKYGIKCYAYTNEEIYLNKPFFLRGDEE